MYYFTQYIRKEHPSAFEILETELKFSSQSYVEFDFKMHSEKTPRGWEINPLINPTRVRSNHQYLCKAINNHSNFVTVQTIIIICSLNKLFFISCTVSTLTHLEVVDNLSLHHVE